MPRHRVLIQLFSFFHNHLSIYFSTIKTQFKANKIQSIREKYQKVNVRTKFDLDLIEEREPSPALSDLTVWIFAFAGI